MRSGRLTYLYIRDCYGDIIADIVASLPRKRCKTFAILGTAGIGKSSLLLVWLKMLLEDPTKFGLATRSFYFQTRSEKIWLYQHEGGNSFSLRLVQNDEQLDASIILFVDMETTDGSPTDHLGICLIFTTFRQTSHYKELTKSGWQKVLSTWSAEEQAEYFNSPQFKEEYGEEVAQCAYNNMFYFGGSIRNNIQVAIHKADPVKIITQEMDAMGEQVCQRFYKLGFGATVDPISDMLVHKNPERMEDNSYNYDAVSSVYSFASPYVLRCFLARNSMLATDARNKYNTGNYNT
mmetsp:Transcript_8956/g.12438  ORF Transcript_8956/g.12438 Transcript_8956/m.12438 type:complete len:292 (-) Transcript_8956:225-1100(-)